MTKFVLVGLIGSQKVIRLIQREYVPTVQMN